MSTHRPSTRSSACGRAKDVLERVQDYGPDLVDLEPKHSPDTLELRRSWLSAERPFIEHFEYAETWGHAALHLRGDRATATICRGLAAEAWKNVDLA